MCSIKKQFQGEQSLFKSGRSALRLFYAIQEVEKQGKNQLSSKFTEYADFPCHKAAAIAVVPRTQLEVHSVLFSLEIRWRANSEVLLLSEKLRGCL